MDRLVWLSFIVIYGVWGTSYLAIRFGLESFPPFQLGAMRCLAAGTILLVYSFATGQAIPKRAQMKGAIIVGFLLLTFGNAGIVFTEQWVSSALVAIIESSVSLWAVCLSLFFGMRPSRREWIGVFLGLIGVVIINCESNLQAYPPGLYIMLTTSAIWAFGSLLSSRIEMPTGTMSAAIQCITGGIGLIIFSIIHRETWTANMSLLSGASLAYLVLFPSLLGYSAYLYLISPKSPHDLHPRVSPALATSYVFVNPIVATTLGIFIGGEHITIFSIMGLGVILVALLLVIKRSSH